MGKEGLEPSLDKSNCVLSAARLPFRHLPIYKMIHQNIPKIKGRLHLLRVTDLWDRGADRNRTYASNNQLVARHCRSGLLSYSPFERYARLAPKIKHHTNHAMMLNKAADHILITPWKKEVAHRDRM